MTLNGKMRGIKEIKSMPKAKNQSKMSGITNKITQTKYVV